MSAKPGKNFKCDICGSETFIEDSSFAGQDPFPEGWVNLRSQLRTSGRYRSASVMESIDATRHNKDTTTELNLDICQDCWMYKVIEINNFYHRLEREKREKESNTLH